MNEANPVAAFAYDEVAYPTPVLAILTPNRLAAVGMLHGWRSADPAKASVLEIGCGDGLNLTAMAAVAPGSCCVGFDLSVEAIARGQALVAAAGLANMDLHAGDIMDYPRDGRQFDYIICHGVHSWIPQIALCDGTRSRDELAEIMADMLKLPVDRAKIDAALAYFASHRIFEA